MAGESGARVAPADASHGDAVARVVHDMRGPLTVIRGLCETLGRDRPEADVRRGLRTIAGEALRLSSALDGLVGAGPPRPGAVDIVRLAAAGAERHRWQADERSVRISVRASARPSVAGDAERLTRAVDNLIRNALRHCSDGGRVRISVTLRTGWVHLCVRDDGAGVAEGDRERIFTPGDRGSSPRGRGEGLGLAIARDIAQAHGGGLTLDRLGAPGASFRLVLPVLGTGGDTSQGVA